MQEYDLIIIGSGPGGYVAALRAAQEGLKTLVIEKDEPGGICLNWGCIPTKTLLESAKHLDAVKRAPEFGINIDGFHIEPLKIWQRKDEVVRSLRKGIEYLLKAKSVELVKGKARLITKDTIEIISDSGTIQVKAKNIIIATGSLPLDLPGIKIDHKNIISSDDLIGLNRIPKSMIIVGGGAIGCEFASLFSHLGTSIEIVELMDSLLPREDKEISKALEVSFKKRGIILKTKTGLESVNSSPDKIEAVFSDKNKSSAELILICVGRRPNTDNLGLESLGVILDKGWIKSDLCLRTSVNNIYAIGDVTGKTLLAHVASRQAEVAVENITGKSKNMDYSAIPNCVFSYPQIASVGLSEDEARERKINYAIGKFPFRALGKAHTAAETEGFVKLIFDKDTHIILGAHIIGAEATESISTLTLAVKNKLKAEDISETIFSHPTFSEIIPEAVFAFFNKPLHAA